MSTDAPNELGELLSAYLDDEVTAEERARVEQLLASDPQAQALYAALRDTAHAVRGLAKDTAPAGVLEALTTRLERETLLGTADPDVTLARHRRPPVRATLAVAAMLAVAIGGGLYVSLKLSEAPQGENTVALKDSGRLRELSPSVLSGGPQETRDTAETEGKALLDFTTHPPAIRQEQSAAAAPEKEADADGAGPAPAVREQRSPVPDLFAEATRDSFTELGITTIEPATDTDAGPPAAPGAVAPAGELDSLALADTGGTAPERSVGNASEGALRGRSDPVAGAEQALLPSADGRTFEQRLAEGESWPALQSHDFANEPLRLTVRFRAQTGAENFRGRVEQLLADRRVPPAAKATRGADDALPGSRATLVRRAANDALPETSRLMYVSGTPGVNFASAAPPGRQVLARIPADWLDDLIEEIATTDAASVALQLGGVRANGVVEARSLAQELVPPPLAGVTLASAAPPANETGWLALLKRLSERLPAQPEPTPVALARRERSAGLEKEMAEDDADAVSTFGLGSATMQEESADTPAAPSASGSVAGAANLATDGAAHSPTAALWPAAPGVQVVVDLITVVIEMDVETAPAAPDVDTDG